MRRLLFVYILLSALLITSGLVNAVDLLDPRVLPIGELNDSIPRYGGTMTVHGGSSGPMTFNPHLATDTSSTQVTDAIFEGLVQLDRSSGLVVPKLARAYEISPDGREVLFHLRRGVLWHDGTEFTADDVVFTFDVVYDLKIGSNSRASLLIDGEAMQYEKIDAYSVKFTLPRPHAPIMYSIGTPIVPVHILGEAYQEGLYQKMWSIDSPLEQIVGTGAWRVASYREDQELVFVKNKNYYEFDHLGNQLPYLNRVILRYYAHVEELSPAFFNGEFDYVRVPANKVQEYVEGGGMHGWEVITAGPNPGTSFIVLNQNPSRVPQPKLAWFSDLSFRQALAHAVDQETILAAAMNGRGYIQTSPISMRNEFFLKDELKTYPYDLQAAHDKLERAGYRQGSDGIRRDQEGNALEFDLLMSPGIPFYQLVGELFQADLAALGIKVHLRLVDFHVMVDKLTATFDWDAMIMSLTGTFDPNGGSNTWLSSGNLHMWHPRQESPQTEWEARIDEIWLEAQQAFDPLVRRELYYEFQDIVAEQVPLLYTVVSENMIAVRDHLRNAIPDVVGGSVASAWNFIWIDR